MGCTASTLPNSGVPNYIAEDYDDFDNRDDIEISHHDDHKSEVHLQNGIDRRNNYITGRPIQQHHQRQRQRQRRQSSFSCGGGSDHHIGMGSGPLSLNCGANPASITDSPEKCKRKEFSSSNAPSYCAAGVHQNIDDYLTEHSRQGLQYESATKQLQQLITPDEYDNLINIHPSQPPFLGSTYWVAVSPSQSSKKSLSYSRNSSTYSSPPQQHHQLLMTPQEGDGHPDNSNGHQYYPSLITPSTVDESSPIRGVDGTIEVDDCATFPTLLTPREDDDEECLTTRKLFSEEGTVATKTPRQSFKFNCIHPSLPSRTVTPPPPSPGRFSKYSNNSPNVTTFSGPGYQSSERYVTTLPSSKDPIRLRITESSNTSCNLHSSPSASSRRSPGDYYSFDPHFLNSSYKITQNGRTYGNGLQIKSCSGFMTLEDINGNVLAVMKSIYATNAPRRIVYAPQQRFKGQMCSSFRLRSMGKCALGSKKQRIMVVEGKEGIKLYPWVMVKKDSADINSPCSIHYVVEEKKSGGSFQCSPAFVGRHGFDDGGQTHTIVSRMDDCENSCDNPKGRRSNKDRRSTGTPCCVIMRDRSNIDAVDMVISPGIDPCLMICYLAMHTKMDLEPVLASVGGF